MLATERIREILEGQGRTVDITCEPFGSVPGFVSFHKTGYPGKTVIVKVFKRLVGVHDDWIERIAEAERELDRARECQKETESDES